MVSPHSFGAENETPLLENLERELLPPSSYSEIQAKVGLIFPGWKILENDPANQIRQNNILIVVEPPEPELCPSCGTNEGVYKHGVRQGRFLDIPRSKYRIGLLVKRQRFRCVNCKKTYLADCSELDAKRYMTKRLVAWIEEAAKRDTFADVARDCGISPKQVREIWLRKHPISKDQLPNCATPEFLGIDEVYVGMKYRCVLTDLKEKKVFDILDDRMRDSVQKYFLKLPNREAIKVVCIDMHGQYLDAMHRAGLEAKVVVDKFHVVSLAVRALDKVRVRLQNELLDEKSLRVQFPKKEEFEEVKKDAKKTRKILQRLGKILLRQRREKLKDKERALLTQWKDQFDELNTAYWLKEGVIELYKFTDKEAAIDHFAKWMKAIPPDLSEFQALKKTYLEWDAPIFTYFEVMETYGLWPGINNGFTEQVNRQIKAINSRGRGYRFEYLREKILQGEFGAKRKQLAAHRTAFQKEKATKGKPKKSLVPDSESLVTPKPDAPKMKRGAKAYVTKDLEELYKLSEEFGELTKLDESATNERFSYKTQIDLLEKRVNETTGGVEPKNFRKELKRLMELKSEERMIRKSNPDQLSLLDLDVANSTVSPEPPS